MSLTDTEIAEKAWLKEARAEISHWTGASAFALTQQAINVAERALESLKEARAKIEAINTETAESLATVGRVVQQVNDENATLRREREPGEHQYVSTACQHGLHEKCRHECKYCAAKCGCLCGHPIGSGEGEE